MKHMSLPVIVLLITATLFAQAAVARGDGPTVNTTSGMVQGVVLPSGIQNFRGIPFAAPPVRDLRWKPPQPPSKWQGVRLADRFAPQCMQTRAATADYFFRNEGTSEDCLYLNVWTPNAGASARLPVFVYFFGGGFVNGDGSEPRYDGESLARKGIVVVTISYRLGIFGFFSHPELTAESPQHASGNYGLMDQTAALRWVQQNISAFGGDPSEVTLGGESAGSFSVSAQMASPFARGLFARATGESGAFANDSPIGPLPREETEKSGTDFGAKVGANSLAALRALSSEELLILSGRPGMPRFVVNVDGYFFPENPVAVYAAGKQAAVPLLAGWNSQESSGRSLLPNPTPEEFKSMLARVFGDRAEQAAKIFPGATPQEAAQSATLIASAQFIALGTWKWVEAQARIGQPVYCYYFSHPRPLGANLVSAAGRGGAGRGGAAADDAGAAAWAAIPRGASHSAEIEYALGNFDNNPNGYGWTPDDRKVSQIMEDYFANFIKTGDPNGPGLPNWPQGKPDANGQVMRMHIDVDTRADVQPRAQYQLLEHVNLRPALPRGGQ